MVDPRHYLPGRRAGPGRDGSYIGAPRGERLDGEAIVSVADEALERRPLEYRIDKLPPFLTVCRRKIGSELQGLWIRHGRKMPRETGTANTT